MITGAHLFDAVEGKGDMMFQPIEAGPVAPKWHPSMVYHEHVKADGREPDRVNRTQVLLATVTPTIIPIRDPLATMISYQQRAENDGALEEERFDPVGHQLDRWLRLAATAEAIFKDYAHIRFLCWDLLSPDRFEVVQHLLGIARDLGLKDAAPSVACAGKMIKNNDLGAYDLKRAYEDHDQNFLESNISNEGYKHLKESEIRLRPFLEALGYRNLQWWS